MLYIKNSGSDRSVFNNLKNKINSIKISSESEMRDLYTRIDNLLRQEFKYYVSSEVIAKLRTYLREIMKVDENADSKITNTILVYILTLQMKRISKTKSMGRQEKFRLRIYNHRKTSSNLNQKKKTAIKKTSAIISTNDASEVLNEILSRY